MRTLRVKMAIEHFTELINNHKYFLHVWKNLSPGEERDLQLARIEHNIEIYYACINRIIKSNQNYLALI